MANETAAEKASREAEEQARKDSTVKAESEAKERADAAEKAKGEVIRRPQAKPVAASDSDPHPTQAELDAMRTGTFRHGREVKADGKSVDYKTR